MADRARTRMCAGERRAEIVAVALPALRPAGLQRRVHRGDRQGGGDLPALPVPALRHQARALPRLLERHHERIEATFRAAAEGVPQEERLHAMGKAYVEPCSPTATRCSADAGLRGERTPSSRRTCASATAGWSSSWPSSPARARRSCGRSSPPACSSTSSPRSTSRRSPASRSGRALVAPGRAARRVTAATSGWARTSATAAPTCRRRSTPSRARRGGARRLGGLRDRARRRGAGPARLLQRLPARATGLAPEALLAACKAVESELGRGALAASRATSATGRARSTSTSCCSTGSPTPPRRCDCRTPSSRCAASCSCRCSSSTPRSSCRAPGRPPPRSPRSGPARPCAGPARRWRSVHRGTSGGPPRTRTGAGGAWQRPRQGQGLRPGTLAASSPGIHLHPARARAGPPEEPLMLLVVDVGNTQTHIGTYDGGELVEHWRFATVRESTADELGVALRSLLGLRGLEFADLDASIVSRHRAVAAAGVARDGASATSTTRCCSSDPGLNHGVGDPLRQPARDRPRPACQRGTGFERVGGAVRDRGFGTAVDARRESAPKASTSAASSSRGSRSPWRR